MQMANDQIKTLSVLESWPPVMRLWYRHFRDCGSTPEEARIEALRETVSRDIDDKPPERMPQNMALGSIFEIGKFKLRWIEKPELFGLREVGSAPSIRGRRNSTGMYSTGPDRDDCLRGVVYRLPKRRGFLVGYERCDWNGRPESGVCFSMEIELHDERYCEHRDGANCECCSDAATEADRVAEKVAEHEYEYNEAYDSANKACYAAGQERDRVVKLLRLARREGIKTLEEVDGFEDVWDDYRRAVRERNDAVDRAEYHGISYREVNQW